MIILLVFLALVTPQTRDDGFGVCPAFTHLHPYRYGFTWWPSEDDKYNSISLDGLCHRDDDDSPIKERPNLPKPKFKPDPKSIWS